MFQRQGQREREIRLPLVVSNCAMACADLGDTAICAL